jgi:hypothetical protein
MHALNTRFIRFSISASPRFETRKTERERDGQAKYIERECVCVKGRGVIHERRRETGIKVIFGETIKKRMIPFLQSLFVQMFTNNLNNKSNPSFNTPLLFLTSAALKSNPPLPCLVSPEPH